MEKGAGLCSRSGVIAFCKGIGHLEKGRGFPSEGVANGKEAGLFLKGTAPFVKGIGQLEKGVGFSRRGCGLQKGGGINS